MGLLLACLLMELGSQLFVGSRAQCLFDELAGLTTFISDKARGLDLGLSAG